ncbi:MAG: thioredoxin-disulfide reductase [Phycisphaerae bacterium]|nr:thioredoxin-disulfide reductase [Phycisphaerae bacterium]
MADGVERVTIIGSGPAGWTAAIYAARANLNPVVYEGQPKRVGALNEIPGGQLMFTTEVENYPGFPKGIEGPEMMMQFREQAKRFDVRIVTRDIARVDFSSRPFKLWDSKDELIESHAVIAATGARANWLGLENEQRLAQSGGGVSACAICDGALPAFRDKEVAVVGGGDSAIEEATYLTKYASKVYIIHRRDELRASKVMRQRALENKKIEVVWDSIVVDVVGDTRIEALRLKNVKSGQVRDMPVGGLFMAIGHTPTTQVFKGQLDLDEKGYVKLTDPGRTTTSVEGVFAAGDVADSVYRQAVTAAGMGCKAAIDAERWLATQGIE